MLAQESDHARELQFTFYREGSEQVAQMVGCSEHNRFCPDEIFDDNAYAELRW